VTPYADPDTAERPRRFSANPYGREMLKSRLEFNEVQQNVNALENRIRLLKRRDESAKIKLT
jgi:hypothetical protein